MKKSTLASFALLVILWLPTVLIAQPPTITSFAPTLGAVGTTVTIIGTGFNTTPANNIVIFGATAATVTAATATQLTVTVPTGATFAPITVLNTTTGLLAYSKTNFTPTFTPSKGSVTTADFQAKVDFATGSGPYSVSIGDLDGDGKADLAVANQTSNTVSVFRNTGSAGTISYAAKVDFATGTATAPYSVSIGDLDGDGKADLAVVNYGSNTVSVIRNNSVFPQTITFPALSNKTFGDAPFTLSAHSLFEFNSQLRKQQYFCCHSQRQHGDDCRRRNYHDHRQSGRQHKFCSGYQCAANPYGESGEPDHYVRSTCE